MFKKLHIKLTLYMTIILMIFMTTMTTGIYFFVYRLFDKATEISMREAASRVDGLTSVEIIFPPFHNDSINRNFFFKTNNIRTNYILYDKEFNLIHVKNEDEKIADAIIEYAVEAFQNKTEIYEKKIINNVEYRIFTKYINKYKTVGVVQIYSDTIYEKMFLNFLRTTLYVTGLLGIIGLVIISYFFTGKTIDPVKESWNRQRNFITDASHELRTPLTVIQTNLDAALCDEDSTIKESEIWLNNAYSETKVMGKLIEQLLTLAKIDANKVVIENKDVNLSRIVKKTFDNMKMIAENKNLIMDLEVEENIFIKGDENRIRQLIVILIDNAIKYTEEGTIKVTLKAIKNKKVLEINDTGIGIKQKDINKIFDRFYRSDKARHRQNGGTGLGLSIAKWIVETHKGTIEVNSAYGKGSSFIVTFNS